MSKLKKILAEFGSQMAAQGLNKEEGVSLALSVEDADFEDMSTVMGGFKTAVDTVLSVSNEDGEEDEFAGVQRRAGVIGAALGVDPEAILQRDLTVKGGDNVISHMDLGIEDAVENVSMEAFDPEAIASAAKFTFGFNLMASKQDEFGETLFPTIVIDPKIAAAEVTANLEMLTQEVLRTEKTSDKSRMNKQSIIKAMVNPNGAFADDKNAIVPVLRATNEDILLADQQFVSNVTGESITTAPIMVGKEVNLLSIGQTDADLTKGVMDNTDALSSRVVLQDIYFSLTDTETTPNTEVFKFNVSAFPFNNFTYSQQDHSKDIALSFSTEALTVVTGTTTTFDGSSSVVLGNAGVAANHTVKFKVVLHGNGNTEYGTISVFASAVELIEVKDAGGNILPSTDAAYIAIKTVFADSISILGYTVEAYTTNSNMREMGQLITVDTVTQRYVVPVRSGIAVQKPVGSNAEGDNDAAWLKAQISAAGIRTSLSAVKSLTDFADQLHSATANGVDLATSKLAGIGRHFVNAYYKRSDIDLSAVVDSLKSSERDEDIKAALTAKIKNAVLAMVSESNYGVALRATNPGTTPTITVVIATSGTLAGYLGTGTDIVIGDRINVKVVSTPNTLMANRMIVSFIVDGAGRNTAPNPLNFGQMFWSPEVSAEMPRQINNRVAKVLTTQPRYLHVANLPVMTDFSISGLDTVIGKVTQNTATV